MRRACGSSAGGRLVEEDHLGVVHQRAGDRQPLQLAAGQLLGAGAGLVGEADQLQPLVGPRRRDAVQGGEGADLLAGGEPLEERRGLQLDADPGQQPRVARPGRLAEQPHLAGVRAAQPLDHLQRGGLAGAVRARGCRRTPRAATVKLTSSTAAQVAVRSCGARRPRWPLPRRTRRHGVDSSVRDHAQPDRQPGQVGVVVGADLVERAHGAARPRRRRPPPSRRPAPAPAGRTSVLGQHLRGQLRVHGVQVVAQRGPRHRLPAVVARQREDPGDQRRQPEPLAEREVHPGDLERVEVVAAGGLDDVERLVRRRQHRDPDGELLGHPLRRRSASRRASNASASRPPSSSGSAATTCWATTPKKSTVASLSIGGRRLLISQRDARSTSVRISSRIRVCTRGVDLVVVGVDLVDQRPGPEDLPGHEVRPHQLVGAWPRSPPRAGGRTSCRRR